MADQQFEPIKVIGLNEKAVKELRTFAHEPAQNSNLIALDLSAEPDPLWIAIFAYRWSQRLFQEVVAEGGLKSVSPYNGDPATRKFHEIEREEAFQLARKIYEPRFACTPSFRDTTVYWAIRSVELFGGMASYTRRCLEVIEETNNAYPSDPRVVARDEEARKKAQIADVQRVQIETHLAQVREAITASTRGRKSKGLAGS